MNKKIPINLICCILLIACSTHSSKHDIYAVNSTVILDGAKETKLSEIAQSVDFIPLETRDDVLINNHCVAYFVDTLLIVRSSGEILIFDPATGKFKYKILGFKDRGPIGYSDSPLPMIINEATHEIILNKWDRFGRWDYTTGQYLGDISAPLFRYSPIYYANDSLLFGCLANADGKDKSSLNLISNKDFSTVREYGFFDEYDYITNEISFDMRRTYNYRDTVGFFSCKIDTIFGIDKKSLNISPRFVMNLGNKLTPQAINAPGEKPQYNLYIAINMIVESERYLFIEFSYDGWLYPTYYDKMSSRTVCYDRYQWSPEVTYGFTNDITGYGKFIPTFVTPDGKKAYQAYQATQFIDMVGEERAAQMGVKENDNPVLMIVTLK